ncbi:unnamed protein product, partial [Symbiodinium sp. CCMP2456]
QVSAEEQKTMFIARFSKDEHLDTLVTWSRLPQCCSQEEVLPVRKGSCYVNRHFVKFLRVQMDHLAHGVARRRLIRAATKMWMTKTLAPYLAVITGSGLHLLIRTGGPLTRGDVIQPGVLEKISELSQLPSSAAVAGDFGNVRYLAQQLLDVVPHESYEERVTQFRKELNEVSDKALELHSTEELPGALDGGLEMELLVESLHDSDLKLQVKAMHAYLSWLTAPNRLTKVDISHGKYQGGTVKTACWTQFLPVNAEQVHNRHGLLVVADDLQKLDLDDKLLGPLMSLHGSSKESVPINFLHIVAGRDAFPGVT